MASMPSWNQFVSQYYNGGQSSGPLPSFDAPSVWENGGFTDFTYNPKLNSSYKGNRNRTAGWNRLVHEGLVNPNTFERGVDYYTRGRPLEIRNLINATANQSAASAIQNAFRNWQMQQMIEMMNPPTPPSPDISPVAVNPALTTLQTFAQSIPATNPMPLGGYASVLAALNATPAPPAMQPQNPLASWIMQYMGR